MALKLISGSNVCLLSQSSCIIISIIETCSILKKQCFNRMLHCVCTSNLICYGFMEGRNKPAWQWILTMDELTVYFLEQGGIQQWLRWTRWFQWVTQTVFNYSNRDDFIDSHSVCVNHSANAKAQVLIKPLNQYSFLKKSCLNVGLSRFVASASFYLCSFINLFFGDCSCTVSTSMTD